MKIIITGGMGFVGTNLINKLIQNKNEIIVIDNFSSNVNNTSDEVELINLDLSDQSQVDNINLESVDILIHLAGPSSGPAAAKDPKGTIDISNRITFNVLNFCKKLRIKRLLFSSSMAVYGDPIELPVNEKSVCKPISYYAIAKLSSEYIIQAFCKSSDIDYSIMRFFNIYGPGQDLTRMDQGIVSIYLSMLLNQKPFVIKGRLDRVRDLIHIDDIVNSIIAIMNSKAGENQVINVCNGEAVTIEKLARIVIKYFRNYTYNDVIEEKGSTDDIHKIFGSNDKLINEIGYKPVYNIETGIKDFVSWAKKVVK